MASVASPRTRALPKLDSLPGSFVLPALVLLGLFAVSLYLRTNSLGVRCGGSVSGPCAR